MKNPVVRWAIFILGGLVMLVLGGAGLIFFLLSRLDMRAEVERAVEQATGRDLTIAGDVGVSFYPVLGLRAENASLANVQGGRAPALASIEAIAIGVEIRPLVTSRTVEVRELRLTAPRIALEVDAQGRPNWALQPARAPGPPSSPGAPRRETAFSLRQVEIRNGEVSYFDARRNAGWNVTAVNLDTALTSLDQPVALKGDLSYAGQVVKIDARADLPRAALAGRPTTIRASVESELLNASFDGQIATATGSYTGEIQATGPSLRRLLAWLVAPIQAGYGLEAFAVNGRLVTAQRQIGFENATLSIDAVRGRGDFALQELRGRPYVSGRLELFEVDLNPYIVSATRPAEAPAQIAEAAAAPARVVDVQAAPSDAPFDFSGLKAINADLELTTGALKIHRMRLDRVQTSLVINDGFLAATVHGLQMYGGTGRGRLEFDARTPDVRVVQELTADNVDARAFMGDAFGFSNLEGRTEVNLNVTTTGRNQSALIRGLDGRVSFELVSGQLHGVDLGGVATTIRRALNNDLVSSTARTPLTGMSAAFTIADGVMATESISFNTPDLRLRGLGVIDLAGRSLDLRLAPQGAILAIPFRAHGPWDRLQYAASLSDRERTALLARVRAVQAAARAPATP